MAGVFRPVSPQVSFPELEEKILAFWREINAFERSLRVGGEPWVFYEGPPTANGLPGTHHVLARVFKDLFPRYQTMKGRYVLRKGGWDTHGLPVELEVERELGFSSKRDIEAYGVAEFNRRCRESVFRYVREWEQMTERIGFWIDMANAYVTMTNEYIESVWWILRQMWDRGLLYQGFKVVPYCTRCGTPLSDHEVAQGYAEAEDPSIYVRFRVRGQPGKSFLVWTTTPWTLPGNAALAVHPEVEYVEARVARDGAQETLIIAAALAAQVLGEHEVVARMPGSALLGMEYEPPYRFLPVEGKAYHVVAGDFVQISEGTGIVHMAPAYGAEDMAVAQREGLPVLQTVQPDGTFVDAVRPWAGMYVKDADPLIVADLRERGLLYREERYRHTYPFCWRCDWPLLYYAHSSWFVRTTAFRDRLVSLNKLINWYPEHIRDGRFGNWLENNVDWALSRDRYWGTPLPIWRCAQCGRAECIGSIEELRGKPESTFDAVFAAGVDLHRPYIDEVTYRCICGGVMQRVSEVIDCWFDSGAMPVAQWHYPFENQELFARQFPADFICEAVDQTRGWFYSLHAIATILFDQPCYRNVICLGHILDEQGQKMSKSRGNVVRWDEVVAQHGADALRWYMYTAAPPGNPRRFSIGLVGQVVRGFLLTLWNTYSFFVTYANIDGFRPDGQPIPVAERALLDRWVLSELNTLVASVDAALAGYDVPGATRPIERFVENLSNWYVRRSRRRFWKSEADRDKQAAYQTLYECLVTLAKLLAPFMPFIAEEMYQNLVVRPLPGAKESVHFCDFPEANRACIDEELERRMSLAMEVVRLGHAARNSAGIKLRQPLRQAVVVARSAQEAQALSGLEDIVADELNVKSLLVSEDDSSVLSYRFAPDPARVGPRYGRLMPAIREALASISDAGLARRLASGESLLLTVQGVSVELGPEDVQVRVEPAPGYAVASESGMTVALDTRLDETLRREGLARELVRRIQSMRKEAGLRIEEHIATYYEADAELEEVFAQHGDYIARETLSDMLVHGPGPQDAYRVSTEVDGMVVSLAIRRLSQ